MKNGAVRKFNPVFIVLRISTGSYRYFAVDQNHSLFFSALMTCLITISKCSHLTNSAVSYVFFLPQPYVIWNPDYQHTRTRYLSLVRHLGKSFTEGVWEGPQ